MKRIIKLTLTTSVLFMLLTSCFNTPQKVIAENFRNVDPREFESDIKTLTLSESNPKKIQINDFSKNQNLNSSALFDSITYIKLSNEENAIIGNINKIVIEDSCFFILDRYKTKSLKKFHSDGSYLATIGKQGAGPEEYVEPTDFIINNGEIIVYDQFKSDLKYYDVNGNFRYKKNVPFIFFKFSRLSPDHYMFYGVNADNDHLQSIVDYSVFESDSSFVLKSRSFYRPKDKYVSYLSENNFSPYKESIFYHPLYNDTIYSIRGNDLQAEYVIDFQEKKLPEQLMLQKNDRERTKAGDTDQYAFFPGNYVRTDDYLYFEYSIERLVHRGIYSNKTGKTIIGNGFLNDINGIFPYQNILTSTGDNILVGYMHSHQIGDKFEKYPRAEWIKQIGERNTQIAESIKSEDNPILLFYKIKDF
jgi:hypothetical protein